MISAFSIQVGGLTTGIAEKIEAGEFETPPQDRNRSRLSLPRNIAVLPEPPLAWHFRAAEHAFGNPGVGEERNLKRTIP